MDRANAFNAIIKKVQTDNQLIHVSAKTISEFLNATNYENMTEQQLLAAFDEYITWVR